jgi:hypothetical protein
MRRALVRSLSDRSAVCFGDGTGGCGSMSIVSLLGARKRVVAEPSMVGKPSSSSMPS